MRTFQFSDAKSHKFWTIDVSGDSFTVTYGKVGTAGQTQTKTFATPEKAAAEAEKLVREKTGKGYVETTPTAATSDREAFERTLAANPHDLAAWCAYSDYLTEQGDPRGEFMQIQLTLEDESQPAAVRKRLKAREKELLAAHEREWLGPLADFLIDQKEPKRAWRTETITYSFRRGWLADLEIPRLGVELARTLNGSPQARLLHRLHVHTNAYEFPEDTPGIPDYADGTYAPGPDLPPDVNSDAAAAYVLSRFPYFASVRTFQLGNPIRANYEDTDHCHTDGAMAIHYLKQMPGIEELHLLAHHVDAAKIFALPMPKLRLLQVFHGTSYPMEKLAANASLGELTHLLLQPHAPDEPKPYIQLRQLRSICRATNMPKLCYLAVRYTAFGDEGVKELVGSGLIGRLRVLDLTGGCVTDKGAELLAGLPEAKTLERVVLDTNALTPDGVKALKDAGVNASAQTQHTDVPPFDEDELPEYLFFADIE